MKSKGVKKCFGLLLVLFIMVGLSLSVSSGFVSALKHEYNAVPFLSPQIPHRYVESDGVYSVDFDHIYDQSEVQSFDSTPSFYLYFEGDGYYPALEDLKFKNNYISLDMGLVDGSCQFNSFSPLLSGGFSVNSNNPNDHSGSVSSQGIMYDSRIKMTGSSIQQKCYYNRPFDSSPQPAFNTSSIPQFYDILADCSLDDGFTCSMSGTRYRSFYNNQMNPYWFTYDGFYTHSTSIDTDSGVHYNNSFSFSDMFTQPIKQFSRLELPLYDYSDYWTDPSNFHEDRHIEFRGAFDFDQPVTLNPNMDPDSYFRVRLFGLDQDFNYINIKILCTFNNVSVPGANNFYRLEYSCRGSYPTNYIWLYPVLEMYNPDSYIFTTDGDWRWAYQFLITDYDETPGQSFGNISRGIGQAVNPDDSSADWFQSLLNLFSFSFINPFAPIFQLFTDNSTCASIPTLAGMIHSNETTICPWFSSETRAIVTPVLGLSSMMLVFGFAVRWLGSGSGNMLEDSVGHDWGGSHFQNKYSRSSKK